MTDEDTTKATTEALVPNHVESTNDPSIVHGLRRPAFRHHP